MSVKKMNGKEFEEEIKTSAGPVVVDFNATWCGPCRMMAPVLEKLSEEKTNITFISVDVDEEGELAQSYEVYSIPCLVMIKNGEEIGRSVGFGGEESVRQFLNKAKE